MAAIFHNKVMSSFQLSLLSLLLLVDVVPVLAQERAIPKSIESPIKARTSPLIRERQERSSKADSGMAAGQTDSDLSSDIEDRPKPIEVIAWLNKLANPHFSNNLRYLLSLQEKRVISIERLNILVSAEVSEEERKGIDQLAQIKKKVESGSISLDKVNEAVKAPLSKLNSHRLLITEAGFRSIHSGSQGVPWGELPQLQWKKGEEQGRLTGSKKLKSLIDRDGEPLPSRREMFSKKDDRAISEKKYNVESYVLDFK